MEEKYFVTEIEFMKDGTIPKGITEKNTRDDAYALFFQISASCFANPNCEKFIIQMNDENGTLIDAQAYCKGLYKPERERLIEVIRSRLDAGEDINNILDTLCL